MAGDRQAGQVTQSAQSPAGKPSPGWLTLLGRYKDRRLLAIFVFGLASGFPWVLMGSAMTAWLQELGVSRSAIGGLGLVGMVFFLNFLWAPLLDRFRPRIFGRLERRRSWIALMQILLLAVTFGIGFLDPSADLRVTSVVLLSLAVCAATQDVAIDAYRVALIPRKDQALISYGAAMATSGWWTGYALLGAVPFLLVDSMGGHWDTLYLWLAGLWLPFLLFSIWLAPTPEVAEGDQTEVSLPGVSSRLVDTVVAPLVEFFQRNGVKLAIGLILFILLFKIGEAFLGRMSIVFYKEVGFSNSEIGVYSKLLNWWVTVVFSIAGSFAIARLGIIRGLVFGGIAMASSNLMFAWIAQVGPQTWLLATAVIVDGFTAAVGTVAFMGFITYLCSHTFTATQYALMASIGNLGRTVLASSGGVLVDWWGGNWTLFFILTAVAVVPSLLLLGWLTPLLRQRYPGAFGKHQVNRSDR